MLLQKSKRMMQLIYVIITVSIDCVEHFSQKTPSRNNFSKDTNDQIFFKSLSNVFYLIANQFCPKL